MQNLIFLVRANWIILSCLIMSYPFPLSLVFLPSSSRFAQFYHHFRTHPDLKFFFLIKYSFGKEFVGIFPYSGIIATSFTIIYL